MYNNTLKLDKIKSTTCFAVYQSLQVLNNYIFMIKLNKIAMLIRLKQN